MTFMTTNAERVEGLVYALAAGPGGVCFAASETGLYRSADGGVTWQSAYQSLLVDRPPLAFSVALSPDGQSVFAGAPGGVLRSADGGATWRIAGLGSPPPAIAALVVSPNYVEDGTLFAGALEDGTYCSTDRGVYWAGWNFGLLDLNVICLAVSPHFAQDETLYAGTETGVFRSTNGGRAWRETEFPLEPVLCLRELRFAPGPPAVCAADGALLAGTESGLYRSEDQGASWTQVAGVHGTVNTLVPMASGGLIACENTLLVSPDAGRTWAVWRDGLHFEGGIAALCALDDALLVAPASGGVLRLA